MSSSPGAPSSIAPRSQRVLRSLCHAIRQPLTAITARAELLEDGCFGPASDEHRRELAHLQQDCARLASLVQDFCDLVRGATPTPQSESADLLDALSSEIHSLAPRAERAGIGLDLCVEPAQLETTRGGTAPIAGASAPQLRQLLARLFEQALRFAPRGTALRIALARESAWWRLQVEDAGPCPLDVDELERDLDRLERPDDLHGLVPELQLARSWVNALGGHFALARTVLGGLRVTALLPAGESNS